jgi:hypothetical protein
MTPLRLEAQVKKVVKGAMDKQAESQKHKKERN